MGNPEQQPVVDDTSKPNGSEVSENNGEEKVDFEKRYKDTQAAFTKSQQKLKAEQAKVQVLEQLTAPTIELDDATKQELDSLKFSDPDAWRARMNTLEKEAHNKHNEKITQAQQSAIQETEFERRAQILADFQVSHPNLIINDEVIKYDVPPRISNKLESGEIDFETYLGEVKDYLTNGKVVGDGNKTLNQPNLSEVGGDDTPTDDATKKDIVKDYADLVL